MNAIRVIKEHHYHLLVMQRLIKHSPDNPEVNGSVTKVKSLIITLKARVITTVKYKVANIIISRSKSYISKVITAVARLLHNQ